LPLKILQNRNLILNYIVLSRINGIPVNYIIQKGQNVRVINCIYVKAKERGFKVLTPEKKEKLDFDGAQVI
jgi:DNA polymerase delta subunit 1